ARSARRGARRHGARANHHNQERETRMNRGSGSLFQPTYKDAKTGETKHVAMWWGAWYAYDVKLGKRHQFKEPMGTSNKTEARRRLNSKLGADADGRVVTATNVNKVSYDTIEKLLITDYRIKKQKGLKRILNACKPLRAAFEHVLA